MTALLPGDCYTTLLAELAASHPFPIPRSSPAPTPLSARLTPRIAALSLHPSLEAALHLRNGDLTAAHFLVRHMQAAPAVEGMALHAVLHRMEGDFDNARAWAGSVGEACGELRRGEEGRSGGEGGEAEEKGRWRLIEEVWGSKEKMSGLVDAVEALRKEGKGDEEELRQETEREWEAIVGWCEGRFGTGAWPDASGEWVRPSEEVRSMGVEMTTGSKGWRKF